MKRHKIMPGAICFDCCVEMKLVDDSVMVRFSFENKEESSFMTFTIEGEKYICPKCKKQILINFQHLPSMRKLGFEEIRLMRSEETNEIEKNVIKWEE